MLILLTSTRLPSFLSLAVQGSYLEPRTPYRTTLHYCFFFSIWHVCLLFRVNKSLTAVLLEQDAGSQQIGFLLGSCGVTVALTSDACLKGLPRTANTAEVIAFKGETPRKPTKKTRARTTKDEKSQPKSRDPLARTFRSTSVSLQCKISNQNRNPPLSIPKQRTNAEEYFWNISQSPIGNTIQTNERSQNPSTLNPVSADCWLLLMLLLLLLLLGDGRLAEIVLVRHRSLEQAAARLAAAAPPPGRHPHVHRGTVAGFSSIPSSCT